MVLPFVDDAAASAPPELPPRDRQHLDLGPQDDRHADAVRRAGRPAAARRPGRVGDRLPPLERHDADGLAQRPRRARALGPAATATALDGYRADVARLPRPRRPAGRGAARRRRPGAAQSAVAHGGVPRAARSRSSGPTSSPAIAARRTRSSCRTSPTRCWTGSSPTISAGGAPPRGRRRTAVAPPSQRAPRCRAVTAPKLVGRATDPRAEARRTTRRSAAAASSPRSAARRPARSSARSRRPRP